MFAGRVFESLRMKGVRKGVGEERGGHTFKWKQATMGSFFIVSCLVDSLCTSQVLHLIFALLPKFSGRVNLSKQSIRDLGVVWLL